MGEPRINSITPRHERGTPSTVEIAVDTGLKSGKLTFVSLDWTQAVALTAKMADATAIVVRVNRERE